MTSKNLFFKYMKENTKQRLWSVALCTLLCFFVFPVITALGIGIAFDNGNLSKNMTTDAALLQAKHRLTDDMLNLYSIQSGMMIFLLIVTAVVLATSGFAYLHSKKKTDFYHSLPISREMLYTATCLDGVLYMAVPYLVFLSVSGIMLQIKGAPFSWGTLFLGYAQHMCFFVLVYMTVVLAVIFTGNTVVGLLGTGVFFCWGPGVVAIITSYFTEYFWTFYDNGNFLMRWCERTSPVFWYATAMFSEHPSRMALIALAAAIVWFGLGMFLYRKRPSEAAGKAMAFGISEPVIRFLLVVPITLFSGMIFHSIMSNDCWTIFGLVCGLLISSCLIEIIYHFDFKSLFAHKKQLAVSAVAVAVVFLGFRLDITGYDSYMPDAENIDSAGIYCDALDSNAAGTYHAVPELQENGNIWIEWPSLGNVADKIHISDEKGISTIREIWKYCIETVQNQKNPSNDNEYAADDEYVAEDESAAEDGSDLYSQFDSIVLAWHLKNGKTVYRSYNTMEVTALRKLLDDIYENKDYKMGMYPVFSLKADDVAGINYKAADDDDGINVNLADEEAKSALLASYQKEFMSLTSEVRRSEKPIAQIQFVTGEMQSIIDKSRDNNGNYSRLDQYFYYPVYPSFTETILLLEKCKISFQGNGGSPETDTLS